MDKIVNEFSKNLQKKIQENDTFNKEWQVEVFEENGVVTLEGAVSSQETSEKAEAFIREQEGVNTVVNKLDVDPNLEENDEEIVVDKDDYVPPIRNHPG